MPKIFIWSGGYDSTLLVYREVIEQYKQKCTNLIKTWSFSYDLLGKIK